MTTPCPTILLGLAVRIAAKLSDNDRKGDDDDFDSFCDHNHQIAAASGRSNLNSVSLSIAESLWCHRSHHHQYHIDNRHRHHLIIIS